jgi:hypothetical protein
MIDVISISADVNGAATEASAFVVKLKPTSAALRAAVSLAPSPMKAV